MPLLFHANRFGLIASLLICPCSIFAIEKFDSQTMLTDESVPGSWSYQAEYATEIPSDTDWWKSFEDPILDSIINVAIANNYDVAMAAKRINIANYNVKTAQAGLYPQLNLNAGWTKSRSSGMLGSQPGNASNSSYFDMGLNMSWQVDLFGKISSQAKGKELLYKASKAEFDGVMLSVASSIAQTYFQLRVWQAELQVANEHSERQRKVVAIAEARFECELASKLDVTQARGVYYSTQASIPVLENSINTAINSLALMMGVYPEDIQYTLRAPAALPDYHQLMPIGVPADLIRRRPDIIASEMELASYAQALGVAKKDFLPTLTINGSIGTSSHRINDMFSKESLGYSITPTLSWTVFDGLSRKYNKAIAREQLEVAIDSYNLSVMTAINDVNDALSSYTASIKHIDALQRVIEQSDESLKLSIDLYKNSLTQFSNVVDAQMSVLENQNSLIVAHGQALSNIVKLYEAIGGGWSNNL
ncbi:MAG: efflux transporter outer membrane subunit [Bacteroidales bacterium]|nr:efflux transporter outer membrane subunit [Bacteroidales bacterium]